MLDLNLDVQPRNLSPLFHQENFELVKLELLLFCCFFSIQSQIRVLFRNKKRRFLSNFCAWHSFVWFMSLLSQSLLLRSAKDGLGFLPPDGATNKSQTTKILKHNSTLNSLNQPELTILSRLHAQGDSKALSTTSALNHLESYSKVYRDFFVRDLVTVPTPEKEPRPKIWIWLQPYFFSLQQTVFSFILCLCAYWVCATKCRELAAF